MPLLTNGPAPGTINPDNLHNIMKHALYKQAAQGFAPLRSLGDRFSFSRKQPGAVSPAKPEKHFTVLIAGGGVTGMAIGYGLARQGIDVGILDASSKKDRASRSNMGLIWCQSKALGNPDYVKWGFLSSQLFPDMTGEIEELSGIDIAYAPSGGIIPCLGEEDFNRRARYIDDLRVEAGGRYPGEMLSRRELAKLLPKITFGDQVTGGTFCDRDGFVEPLKLMFAFRQAMVRKGGTFLNNTRVTDITPMGDTAGGKNSRYIVTTKDRTYSCDRLVLAGGLGNCQLAGRFNVRVPITPDRGQVLLTERVGNILPIPILGITRTPGGTIMVGFMHENVGTDTALVPESVAREALWAESVWPGIADLRVIRCWSSLRVMPRDGFPIYDTLPGHPGIFLVNAHSAVTLAAVHAQILPGFIMGRDITRELEGINLDRFRLDRFEQQPR